MVRMQTESGARNAQEAEYNGRTVVVVTDYDARSDKWPIHVYIEQPGNPTRKVEGQWFAKSRIEAFDSGFIIGMEDVDNAVAALGH